MEERRFTNEELKVVKHLTENGHLVNVRGTTLPGIYTFRTYRGVVLIWNIRSVWTDRTEVLFDFCVDHHNFKEGGVYYKDGFSRDLRKKQVQTVSNIGCEISLLFF